ncbi:MAG: mechanosensitive ion channel family protein [Bacteroidetes bacterium]|nr:MAG: mechanosensitive ion channel family protein [Bacteroidota bacterium]
MEDLTLFMQQTFFGNSVWQYTSMLLIILAGVFFKRFVSRFSNRLLFRLFRNYTKDIPIDRFHDLMHKPVGLFIMLLVIFVAFTQVSFPEQWDLAPRSSFGINMLLFRGFFIALYFSIIWIFLRLGDFMGLVMISRATKTEDKYSGQIIPFFVDFIKIIIVIFGVFFILGTIFYVNVGTLVAGLGIGGLAIALAAKETLENLMGSFTIFLDKPFVQGDMVRVAGITGVVEKVGFRSTRLRTLEKSFVTLPNKKMIDSELDNLSMRTFRRANFMVGVTYSTTPEKLKSIVSAIQSYIDNHPNTNQEGKVRFHEFGPSSLDIMILFFVDTMDWTTYLDVKEEILYEIISIVQKNGAEFAYPSTSVYIEKNINNPSN